MEIKKKHLSKRNKKQYQKYKFSPNKNVSRRNKTRIFSLSRKNSLKNNWYIIKIFFYF